MSNIIVTEAAANKVWSLMLEEENLDLCLRAFISGGGCSGFQYNFTFEEGGPGEEDRSFKTPVTTDDNGHVTLLVDPASYPYLKGSSIDYEEGIGGAQFVIRGNPNAKTTCGCGSSFSG